MNTKTTYLTKAGVIAAIYVILVAIEIPFGTLAFGPVQIRVAEALVLLPLVEVAAIPGVFIGCILANTLLSFASGYGIIDIVGGSLVTLIAAYLTHLSAIFGRHSRWIGVLPPVILNGLIVSMWVSMLVGIPYWPTVIGIGAGELIAVGVFGNIVLYAYKRAVGR